MEIMIILGWALVSGIAYIWCFFSTDEENRLSKKSRKIKKIIDIGAFFCLFLVIASGMKGLLFYILESWGTDVEGGDLESGAFILAIFVAVFISYVVAQYEKMRTWYHKAIITEVVTRTKGWYYELHDLVNAKIDGAQSDEEIQVLQKVIKILENTEKHYEYIQHERIRIWDYKAFDVEVNRRTRAWHDYNQDLINEMIKEVEYDEEVKVLEEVLEDLNGLILFSNYAYSSASSYFVRSYSSSTVHDKLIPL